MEKMDPKVQLQPEQFWESSAPGHDPDWTDLHRFLAIAIAGITLAVAMALAKPDLVRFYLFLIWLWQV